MGVETSRRAPTNKISGRIRRINPTSLQTRCPGNKAKLDDYLYSGMFINGAHYSSRMFSVKIHLGSGANLFGRINPAIQSPESFDQEVYFP